MKIFFITITFFLLSISYSQSNYESGVIEYGVDLNDQVFKIIEQKENTKYPESIVASFEKLISYHKKIYSRNVSFLNLSFKNNTYILEPIDIMIPENLRGKFIFQSKIYYHDISNCVYLKKFQRRGEVYIAPLKREYNWEIKKNSKNILGFKCRKAIIEKEFHSKKLNITETRKIIAWFTPQIPVTLSPVKYYGLPGAILEITTPLKHIYAKNIEFKDDVEVKKPTEGIKLTAEEYKEMISGFKPPE